MFSYRYDGSVVEMTEKDYLTLDIVWNYPSGVEHAGAIEMVSQSVSLDEIISMFRQRKELLEALENLKHDDGCFCDASFAGPGTIVRHSDECMAAMDAIAKARGEQ